MASKNVEYIELLQAFGLSSKEVLKSGNEIAYRLCCFIEDALQLGGGTESSPPTTTVGMVAALRERGARKGSQPQRPTGGEASPPQRLSVVSNGGAEMRSANGSVTSHVVIRRIGDGKDPRRSPSERGSVVPHMPTPPTAKQRSPSTRTNRVSASPRDGTMSPTGRTPCPSTGSFPDTSTELGVSDDGRASVRAMWRRESGEEDGLFELLDHDPPAPSSPTVPLRRKISHQSALTGSGNTSEPFSAGSEPQQPPSPSPPKTSHQAVLAGSGMSQIGPSNDSFIPPSPAQHATAPPSQTASQVGGITSYGGSFHGRPATNSTSKIFSATDSAGFKTINQYTILQHLGNGTSGKVKLVCSATDNETYALKIVKKKRLRVSGEELHTEVGIMVSLHHKHIVPLVEVIDDPNSPKVYMVMPYIDGGPILKYNREGRCEKVPALKAQLEIRQLIGGLSYLHSKGIVHSDIKPDNILRTSDGHVFIADFGSSVFFNAPERCGVKGLGTPLFMAPEMFAPITADTFCGTHVDVWSLGVIVFSMLFGFHPFYATTYDVLENLVTCAPLPVPDDAPELEADLVRQLLEKDPAKRITLEMLRMHPWIRSQRALAHSNKRAH